MRVLLDTCVISELHREGGHTGVRSVIASHRPEEVFLSVITMGELTKGLVRLPEGRMRTNLAEWMRGLDRDFQGRILGVERETVGIWGEITALAEMRGRILPPADGLIAATAIQHGLRVLTRNVSDFSVAGAMVVNPWSGI